MAESGRTLGEDDTPPPAEHAWKLKAGTATARWAMMRLAEGWTYQRVANALGIGVPSVGKFAAKHALKIQAYKEDAAEALKELWIADKTARVAFYQDQADAVAAERGIRLQALATVAEVEPKEVPDMDGMDAKLETVAQRAVRSVAEELGSLPARVIVPTTGDGPIVFNIPGVDTSKV